MEEQAEIEDEEITAIWMQIKATLAKVRICLIFLRLQILHLFVSYVCCI